MVPAILLCCGSLVATVTYAAEGIDIFGRPLAASAAAAASPALQRDSVVRQGDAAEPDAIEVPGPVRKAVLAGVRLQARWNARVQDAAARIGTERDPRLWATLLLLSFAYGVLHALGPGHGKLVVGTYLGSRGARARHAILLSGWTAAVQAMCAIIVVMGSILVTRAGAQGILSRAVSLELVSYVLLCVAGSWTVWSVATRRDCCVDTGKVVLIPRRPNVQDGQADQDREYLGNRLTIRSHPALRQPAQIRIMPFRHMNWMRSQIFLTGLGAGMRPCAGAIFVLVVSAGAHVPEAGISAALAMALGVTVTVSLVGLGAAGLNRVAGRIGIRYRVGIARMQRTMALLGGIAIVVFAALQTALLLAGGLTPTLT
ncbi:nickel/cobalt transporter [Paraburkholderia sp. GAS41]|uniref:nickel/cobalt transporter n=1 Tax=Paraburkholderia sp. GAS41 TaxID=3035134 RepID=UPI003D22E491